MQEEEVHIIMTDQRMPQVSGVELLTKVKAKNPQAVRMLFTGYADLESIIAAINQGHVYQFLKKPWQPEELLEAVRQAAVEYERLIADADHGEKLRAEIASLQQRVTALEEEVRRLGGNPERRRMDRAERRTDRERMATEERRHTLLIVDDEPGLLQSLRHQFFRDYRVLTAENGHAALDLLGREDVHVILSDQRMPGMTGDAFLAQARAVRPDAVRMLFTGYADIQAVISAVNEGRIFRYILKPWDPAELEGIVRQAVEHHDLIVGPEAADRRAEGGQRAPDPGQPRAERGQRAEAGPAGDRPAPVRPGGAGHGGSRRWRNRPRGAARRRSGADSAGGR